MKAYIYKIQNKINGKLYIGQTVQTINKRWSEHCHNSSTCKILRSAILKYGKENFDVSVLHTLECDDKPTLRIELNRLETEEIEKNRSLVPNGYNILKGGNTSPGRRWKTPPMIGKKMTLESRRKISIANMGKKKGPKPLQSVIDGAKKREKPIRCNENGQEWSSIKECAEFFNVKTESIHRVLRGVRDHFHGMSFSYINPERSKPRKMREKKIRSIDSYDLTGFTKQREKSKRPIKCNETGQTWDSIRAASIDFKVKHEDIHRVLRCVRKSLRNLTFSYI